MGTITLHRKGNIETSEEALNQCKDRAWPAYAYRVALQVDESNLDGQEFIIDNTVVHKAVLHCFTSGLTSCEGMVKKVADCLEGRCREHNTCLITLEVSIKPRLVDTSSYAWFTLRRNYRLNKGIKRAIAYLTLGAAKRQAAGLF